MGNTSSSVIPEVLDESIAKELAGVYWDEGKFNSTKNAEGFVTRIQFEEEANSLFDRLRSKYCEVSDVYKKRLWEPLVMSNFYDILHNKDFGCYSEYDEGDVKWRRKLLLLSFRECEIDLKAFNCDGSCNRFFSDGVVCAGDMTCTGMRRPGESNNSPHTAAVASTTESNIEPAHIWNDFSTADPDEIAIHLWTYSMSKRRNDSSQRLQEAFYKRVNMALLQDDREMLKKMSYLICGIIRWITNHSPKFEKKTCLYRGTPMSKEQEVEPGTALPSRSSEVDKEVIEASKNICRMPLFVAVSESLPKAQEFCRIKPNGIACPILEFVIDEGAKCESVAKIESLSHFPDEKEWLIRPYAPYRYLSQRLEFLEVSDKHLIKCVMVVSYEVLSYSWAFQHFESKSQDIKSALLLCKPPLQAFVSEEEGSPIVDSILKEKGVTLDMSFLDEFADDLQEGASRFSKQATRFHRRGVCGKVCKVLCFPCRAVSYCLEVCSAHRRKRENKPYSEQEVRKLASISVRKSDREKAQQLVEQHERRRLDAEKTINIIKPEIEQLTNDINIQSEKRMSLLELVTGMAYDLEKLKSEANNHLHVASDAAEEEVELKEEVQQALRLRQACAAVLQRNVYKESLEAEISAATNRWIERESESWQDLPEGPRKTDAENNFMIKKALVHAEGEAYKFYVAAEYDYEAFIDDKEKMSIDMNEYLSDPKSAMLEIDNKLSEVPEVLKELQSKQVEQLKKYQELLPLVSEKQLRFNVEKQKYSAIVTELQKNRDQLCDKNDQLLDSEAVFWEKLNFGWDRVAREIHSKCEMKRFCCF